MDYAALAPFILMIGMSALLLGMSIWYTGKLSQQLKTSKYEQGLLQTQINTLKIMLEKEQENNKVILSQKKSSETRLGQISENIVPFLEEFPYDPKNAHFMGQPIDFLIFDYDDGKIVFLEVKTGNAKESYRQKLIKNIIKSGRVFYERIRINEKGVNVRVTENLE